jgi:hypothetical protein
MKNSTKIKLIKAITSYTGYTNKDKLRLIKNLLDETLLSSTIQTDQPTNNIKVETQTEHLLTKLPKKLAYRITEIYDRDLSYKNLSEIIEAGFIWGSTSAGEEYWDKLSKLVYFYGKLPQPYQDQALKNIDMDCVGDLRLDTIAQSVGNGFFWKNTEQGYDYWDKLFKTL